ncbi:MAG TPA: hypothetical protein V6D33_11020, partial [Cyanophyceae cyanobacterium]
MPVLGRRVILEKPNFVRRLPGLPVPMQLGSISLSLSFEQQPTGSLSYEGITIADKARFEQAYLLPISQKTPPKIDLFGVHLVAESYAYDRSHYIFDGSLKFDRYKVSISLKGRYEELLGTSIKPFKYVSRSTKKISIARLAAIAKVPYSGPAFDYEFESDDPNLEVTLSAAIESKLRILECYVDYAQGVTLHHIDTGGSWNFLTEDVLTDGSNTAKAFVAYNRAVATLEDDKKDDKDEDAKGAKFTKKEPKTEILVEEDENPGAPDVNTTILKTIDSNSVDGSGRKKTRKTTTQVDGTVIKVVTETFGFLYTAANINAGDGVLLCTTPEDFWTLIEYQEETHIYESAPNLALSIKAEVPPQYAAMGVTGQTVNLVIDPDYDQFAVATAMGDQVQFQSSAKYLTQVKTTGWRYARLEKETDNLETISLTDEPNRL